MGDRELDIREAQQEPYPVEVRLTTADCRRLLNGYFGLEKLDGPTAPVALLFGIPVLYAERSEIVYSDGTARPL